MAKAKGSPKTGGRQKGSVNKKTLLLRETFEKLNFDPVKKLIELYPNLDDPNKANVLLRLIDFTYAKPANYSPDTDEETVKVNVTVNAKND